MSTSDTPLVVALDALADAEPERPALTCEGRTVTRAELAARSNRLARAYAELGVRQGDFVSIGLPNGIEFFESLVATWKVGATPAPMSSRLPGRERHSLIELVDPALCVGVDPADSAGRLAIRAGYEPAEHLSTGPLPPIVSPSWKAPASGGSTGRPKVIVSTSSAVMGSVAPFSAILRMPHDGIELTTGPLYHNGPLLMACCALLNGCHVVVMPRFDALRALELVQEHGVDWMYTVPTMLGRMWRLPDETKAALDLSSLRTVFHVGAPCPPWLKRAWIDWVGADVVLEMYAPTEVQAVCMIDGPDWLAHPGSVGRPVIGEMQVTDSAGHPVPAGEVGEIWLRRGAGAPSPYRYLGGTARRREDGWESVGDLGSIDTDGYVYLADRETDMILVGAANVYPAEVEAALDEHPSVRSSAVIGLPDDDLGSVPHAIVETAGEVSDEELRAHLSERLAGYKMPRSYERSETPLRDDAGKVRRSALRSERVTPPG